MSDNYKRDYLLRQINEFKKVLRVQNIQEISNDESIEHLIFECARLKTLYEDKLKKPHTVAYDNKEELIEKTGRFKIYCHEQKGILAHPIWKVYDGNMNLVELYMGPKKFSDTIKFPPNSDRKEYLLEKCDINFESFYKYAKEADNDKYRELTSENAIIEFLINDD